MATQYWIGCQADWMQHWLNICVSVRLIDTITPILHWLVRLTVSMPTEHSVSVDDFRHITNHIALGVSLTGFNTDWILYQYLPIRHPHHTIGIGGQAICCNTWLNIVSVSANPTPSPTNMDWCQADLWYSYGIFCQCPTIPTPSQWKIALGVRLTFSTPTEYCVNVCQVDTMATQYGLVSGWLDQHWLNIQSCPRIRRTARQYSLQWCRQPTKWLLVIDTLATALHMIAEFRTL